MLLPLTRAPRTDRPGPSSLAVNLLAISQPQTGGPSFTKYIYLLAEVGVIDPFQPGPVSSLFLLMAAPTGPRYFSDRHSQFSRLESPESALTPPRSPAPTSISSSALMTGMSLFSSTILVCHLPETFIPCQLPSLSTGSPELRSHFHPSAEHLAVSLPPIML